MYEILFYEDARGRKPIKEFLETLENKSATSKDARVLLKKIVACLDALEEYGTWVGSPVTKHIDGDIWELRPLDERILYFMWRDGKFVLLHHFHKKTNKTPRKEIEQAKRNMEDYIERNGKYE